MESISKASADSARPEVALREVVAEDLSLFFAHQLDPQANRMAAFTSGDPSDRAAFDTRWAGILGNPAMVKRTVLYRGTVAGHVLVYEQDGRPEITYWIDRDHWGHGIAGRALALFLNEYEIRPLHARVAKDNAGSLRVLQNNGFATVGEGRGFAQGRGEEVEEFLLRLDFPGS